MTHTKTYERMWIPALAAMLLGAATTVATAQPLLPQDIEFRTGKGGMQSGVRCAAPKVSRAERESVDRRLRAARNGNANKGPKQPTPTPTPPPNYSRGPNGEIPVVVHVVYKESKRGGREGYVEPWQLEAQIDVLNDAFTGSGFQFYLAGAEWTNNSKWFGNCYNYSTEYEMKQALAVDPAHVLNVYTCKPQQGILGYAYYPWTFDEADVRHGVVALHASLPGGTAAPYDEGDTVTHEVGHYLGLYHTFEGGCGDPGDYVADTPAEASPEYYCAEERDSCPAPGLDPVHNYMDYGDDACMDHFTGGQVTRMQTAVSVYRPSL